MEGSLPNLQGKRHVPGPVELKPAQPQRSQSRKSNAAPMVRWVAPTSTDWSTLRSVQTLNHDALVRATTPDNRCPDIPKHYITTDAGHQRPASTGLQRRFRAFTTALLCT